MLLYLTRRVLLLAPILLGVAFVVVAFLKFTPGDPVEMMLEKHRDPGQIARLRRQYAILGEDLPAQYLHFVKNVAWHGDFGRSLHTGRPVSTEIFERFPATIELALAAMLLAALFGVGLGVLSAERQGGFVDTAAMALALVGVSVPIFWLGVLALQFLSAKLGLFPVTGRLDTMIELAPVTGSVLVDAVLARRPDVLGNALWHLVLPAAVLATVPTSIIARLTRAAMIEALNSDYVRTARAKGLSARAVTYKHALRNASVGVVTAIGTQFGYLLGGAVLTETIFSWPGLGRYVVESVARKDFQAIQGGVFLIATTFVLTNLVVDLSYAWLDPRIRAGDKS